MGKPKFSRKKYETPSHPWKEQRIRDENELIKKYGLKNKREIWKAETTLRKYRGQARELLAKIDSNDPQIKKESNQLITRLTRFNVLPLNATLDDVLALDTEAFLARRLQTLTYLKGLANTPKQARQLISHGHIAIAQRRITVPSYNVSKDEENMIEYTTDSALNDAAHPARPTGEFTSTITTGAPEPTPADKAPSTQPKKPQKPKEKEEKKTESKEPQKQQPLKETKETTDTKPSPESSEKKSPEKKPEKTPEKLQEKKETSKPEKIPEKPQEKKETSEPEKAQETTKESKETEKDKPKDSTADKEDK